jgi:hypothetical protein
MITITISGADKSGSLARISTLLVRKGFRLGAQQIAESGHGAKLVKISLEVSQVDKAKLAAELGGLNPDFRLVSVEGVQSGAPSIKEMAERFPDIAPLVRAYAESFSAETRDHELFQAGSKIGAFHYEKEWSFGSPLKMPVALRRTLVPALEKLAKVDATDTSITLPDSPLWGGGNQVNCCEFLTGFMQGFLDAGPLTNNARVQKTACRAKGDSHCTYAVSYDL